ncbi:SsrA-binding protein SmpB [Akkermansiaceae bacterium]|jgi:SsrA-binding protein|nr:SsrA-binding protein SmpB [Akkermansiaceae bacterium]MDA7930783.1 SsrA-binding protein SmpB [Akkermansiaceae bacterium]MDB4400692.1 SsrA-binding protein SmpB [Akkermansiaceae bacterium]MDB4519939.1 SsrA-binding protein SmpB [Akkermansiaceae bacterium]|tara:strand:- start:3998 stop:4456 length:459 start_codon:yes stop_codon:yes gene_type:complete
MAQDSVTNKRARRDYTIESTLEAGLILVGTEVKSIREGKVNIGDAFARIEGNQAFLYGCDIQPWQTAGEWFQHASKRPRKLLLHKSEIIKLAMATQQKGFTIICLRLYFKGRRVKVELGLGKGKAHGDQRQDLKKRTELREAQREVAKFNRR